MESRLAKAAFQPPTLQGPFAGTADLSDASHFSTALGQVIAFNPATTVMKVFTWETQGLPFFITLIFALVIMSIGYHSKHGRWSIEM